MVDLSPLAPTEQIQAPASSCYTAAASRGPCCIPIVGTYIHGLERNRRAAKSDQSEPYDRGAGRPYCNSEARRLGRSEHVKPHMQVAAGGLVTFTFT